LPYLCGREGTGKAWIAPSLRGPKMMRKERRDNHNYIVVTPIPPEYGTDFLE